MRVANTIKYGVSKKKRSLRYSELLKTNEVTYFEVVAARNRCSNAYSVFNLTTTSKIPQLAGMSASGPAMPTNFRLKHKNINPHNWLCRASVHAIYFTFA